MHPASTLLTLVTTAPFLQPDLLIKRGNTVCGNLGNSYAFAQAPVCSDQSSICTFLNGFQGCCDNNQSCRFYNSCLGPLASPLSCTDTSCLQCPSSAPYCTKYNFYDGTRAYDGYSCGTTDISTTTVYGIIGSAAVTVATPTPSATPSSTTSTQTAQSSNTATFTGNTSTPSTSSNPSTSTFYDVSSSTSTPQQSSVSGAAASASSTGASAAVVSSKSHTGAIAGGVVGGVIGLAIIVGLVLWFAGDKLGCGSSSDSGSSREARPRPANDSAPPPPQYSRHGGQNMATVNR